MSPQSFVIRRAVSQDLPELLNLYQELSPGDEIPAPDLARSIFERFQAYSGSGIFVGFADERMATSCTLLVVPNLTRGGASYALIENVVTRAYFRRRGFGKQILRAACDAAWSQGCYKVMLMTGSKRQETLDFYVQAGFEQSKTGFQMRRLPARDER